MPDEIMPRFADQKLHQLASEFEQHKADFERHKIEQDVKFDQLVDAVRRNTEATERIALAVEQQSINTAGIVQLYQDFQGAARIGMGIRRVILWLVSIGAITVSAGAAWLHFVERIGAPGP